ncbi:MAG: amino acid permease [Acidobacteria bacterium]|nr:amino acid permease [Acidobacteriota bacterium]MCA1608962.1 amino acid permease [Acidobacteriota bacterium]
MKRSEIAKVNGTAVFATNNRETAAPRPVLSLADAVAVTVGIVVGAGIFRTPSLVAANSGSEAAFFGAWILGGLISMVGAVCYAELATTFPSAGGDYHFLSRAFGRKVSFLFAWARMSVVQTGSVALLAFIFGDYISQLAPLGEFSSAIYAASAVVALTAINVARISFGTGTQKILTAIEIFGVLAVIAAGLLFSPSSAKTVVKETGSGSAFGLTMVFVLLTYGGWNEAAYLSAELREGRHGKKQMAMALILGICIITALYLLVNLAYVKALGLAGMAASEAVAREATALAFGDVGAAAIALLVGLSALTSANATIFTGARTNYALGRDFRLFRALGRWNAETGAPVNAFIVQALVSLGLIGLGLLTRKGFETIVEYTAPVFWFFFLLAGISLFVLRRREPDIERPFPVPLYPLTPIVFCLSSAYLLYSSLMYTGVGALIGVVVLVFGGVLFALLSRSETSRQTI